MWLQLRNFALQVLFFGWALLFSSCAARHDGLVRNYKVVRYGILSPEFCLAVAYTRHDTGQQRAASKAPERSNTPLSPPSSLTRLPASPALLAEPTS